MNYTTITSDKSKKTTLIVCLIGGIFGAHDFYLGKIGKGIIKLFTCNLCGIGWVIDLIKISTGGYRDNANAPIRK